MISVLLSLPVERARKWFNPFSRLKSKLSYLVYPEQLACLLLFRRDYTNTHCK